MKYLMLICDKNEKDQANTRCQAEPRSAPEYAAFGEEMTKRGVSRTARQAAPDDGRHHGAGAQRRRVASGRPVRARPRSRSAGTDLVDCKDLDEALEVAAKVPTARTGSIEVRPVWEM